jgi:UDP-N-acetylglucosamine--N-acetylmuramyl-(pentapeptide) pyrophosphoryl-undecaprenol N-acetylglucosamine transferase
MRVIFAGGGTGGHIFPAVAVIEELRARAGEDFEPLFVLGGSRGAALLERYDVPVRSIPVRGMPRRSPAAVPAFFLRLGLGTLQSFGFLLRKRPAAVLAMGGYASTPVACAGALLRVPVFAAEQNTVAGVATRWNARFARRVFLAYEEARAGLGAGARCVVTGNPVRPEILKGDRERALERWELDRGRRTILVLGGSQGARTMNRIVREALERWEPGDSAQVLFQTGEADYEAVRDSCSRIALPVRAVPFLTDVGDAYGAADLVVCRAGASTLAEITALGLPSILIPFPAATDRHQSKNARVLAERGAALCHEEKDLTPETLLEEMRGLLLDDARRRDMGRRARELGRPDAAKRIVEEILAATRKGEHLGRTHDDRREAAAEGGVR